MQDVASVTAGRLAGKRGSTLIERRYNAPVRVTEFLNTSLPASTGG